MRRLFVVLLLFSVLTPTISSQIVSNAYPIPTAAKFDDGVDIRSNVHYYSVYVDALCINHESGWFRKNLISVTAKLTVNGKDIDVPVFGGLAKESCRIAAAHTLVLSSVPTTDPVLKIGVDIRRFDTKDFMVRVLNFVNGSKDDPLLKTYATAYLPYISFAGQMGTKLYNAFGPDAGGAALMEFKGTTFNADSQSGAPYRLRDTYLLLYSGASTFDPSKLQVTNGDVLYSGKPVQDGAWALFRIEKAVTRSDLAGREWHVKFETSVRELAKPKPDNSVVVKNFEDAGVLLFSDQDFTDKDKNRIYAEYRAALEKAKAFNSSGHSSDVRQAIEASVVQPQVSSVDPDTIVTPTSTSQMVFFPTSMTASASAVKDPGSLSTTIDPGRLNHSLGSIRF